MTILYGLPNGFLSTESTSSDQYVFLLLLMEFLSWRLASQWVLYTLASSASARSLLISVNVSAAWRRMRPIRVSILVLALFALTQTKRSAVISEFHQWTGGLPDHGTRLLGRAKLQAEENIVSKSVAAEFTSCLLHNSTPAYQSASRKPV